MSSAIRRPTGYRIVLPPAWWHIPLDNGRHASVAALVRHQVRRSPKDAAALLRGGLRRELTGVVERAAHAGACDLYLSLGVERGIPLAASLLVQRMAVPVAPGEDVLEFVEAVAGQRDGVPRRLLVGGAEAVAVRRVELLPVRDDLVLAGDAAPVDLSSVPRPCTTNLDVFVPVPSDEALLLLAFSTPVPPLAEAFVDLFEAVAQSLTWSYPARRTPAPPGGRAASRAPAMRFDDSGRGRAGQRRWA
ncbi:hypothetical protein [Motilibacter deserti]|uniref:Condensation domain-containing protein n=1 Tax=Motilibacter deserti TaxID=2714956 RepID=A0ABX0GXV6_9ACTN|nr:hypothetical protein [Motilibacter deserti]NHC14535.1 hypothetical protein [Motilibacter deserti]